MYRDCHLGWIASTSHSIFPSSKIRLTHFSTSKYSMKLHSPTTPTLFCWTNTCRSACVRPNPRTRFKIGSASSQTSSLGTSRLTRCTGGIINSASSFVMSLDASVSLGRCSATPCNCISNHWSHVWTTRMFKQHLACLSWIHRSDNTGVGPSLLCTQLANAMVLSGET